MIFIVIYSRGCKCFKTTPVNFHKIKKFILHLTENDIQVNTEGCLQQSDVIAPVCYKNVLEQSSSYSHGIN